ncbi:MAG: hypothetical protein QFX36_02030 [Archaeoglobales archaeon]|nr:hypothetical protein [Archaeoglobales archaeon]
MKESVNEKGASLLVEYLILMGILSVFVVVMSLQIHETLSEVQVARVMENNLADVASKISAIYTDYVLMIPGEGYITTKMYVPSDIGGRSYYAKLDELGGIAYVLTSDGKLRAFSGLGLNMFITNTGRVTKVSTGGEAFSHQAESEEKPEVQFNKTKVCPFIPKPRIEFLPSSVAYEEEAIIKVNFANPTGEISQPINWELILWNGSIISGSEIQRSIPITISNIDGCSQRNANDFDCIATITARIADPTLGHCNESYEKLLTVSLNPEQSNPYLVYEKWVEPRIVAPGDIFEIHLRIEGRGFFVEGATNLSVVHVIDVSGSMIWPTIFKDYSFTVNPNVVRETVTLNSRGKLEIWAYTSDRLTSWYSNEACKVCSGSTNTSKCPWYNVGYDESFIKLYVNGVDSGGDYNSGGKIGKYYSQNNASAGNYTIEVVARAPEQINLTIVVRYNNTEILNKNYQYVNKQEVEFELPPLPSGGSYGFLAVVGVQNLPVWTERVWNTNWIRIEPSGDTHYWRYNFSTCGYNSFNDNKLNVWFVKADNTKEFLVKGNNKTVMSWCTDWDRRERCTRYAYWNSTAWYVAQDDYSISGRENFNMSADAFIKNPTPGTYKFVVVPTSKETATFTATALIKRIDAAKLAGITFNGMLGEKDFVGLTTFTTDAQRIVVNSSSTVLKYMTNDKSAVNSRILGLKPDSATDHADGLYYGSRVFPIWNEVGNNCSACISGLRPLIIMLTDGEPTICNRNELYYSCSLCTQSCDRRSWCEVAKNQALCIANYLKENVQVNGFNISICTIGFSTDVTGRAQEFLKQMASLRPDNNEPCYFFATTSDELVKAYRTIFNAFQIAAKSIIAQETLNVSMSSPFKFVSAKITSNKGTSIPYEVWEYSNNTMITMNITSIQKDEVIELIVKLKVKDDALYGEYDLNDDSNSSMCYTALDNMGNEIDRICIPITSTRDKVKIVSGEEASIILR